MLHGQLSHLEGKSDLLHQTELNAAGSGGQDVDPKASLRRESQAERQSLRAYLILSSATRGRGHWAWGTLDAMVRTVSHTEWVLDKGECFRAPGRATSLP